MYKFRPIMLTVVWCLSVTVFSGSVFAADKSAPPTKASVIAGIVEAYGGKDAIRDAGSVYAKGDITAVMRGEKGTYTRYMKRGKKLRVEVDYSSTDELRILNGDDGWRGVDRASLHKVVLYQYSAMLYQYKQLDLPYGLMTGAYSVRLVGKGSVGGRIAYILSINDIDGPPMDVYVDSKDYRILKVAGYFDVNGKNVDLTAEFGDYRKVEGILLPFSVANFSGGMPIGETSIKEYKVNMKMKDSLFRP